MKYLLLGFIYLFGSMNTPAEAQTESRIEYDFLAALPAFKVTDSIRGDAIFDTQVLKSAAFGVTAVPSKKVNDKWQSKKINFSVLALISGEQSTQSILDISLGFAIGLNLRSSGLLMFGIGYDFGSVQKKANDMDRNRLFGMLGVGIRFKD